MTVPKFCVTCQHYTEPVYKGQAPALCKFHPMSKTTTYMRDHKSLCGPDARYHKERQR